MMKFYNVLIYLFTGLVAYRKSIGLVWNSITKQKEVPKIMVDMYTTGPCRMLDKNTFSNKKLAAYVNNFYAVKFNAEGNAVVNFKDQELSNPNTTRQSQRETANTSWHNILASVLILPSYS